MNSYRHALSSAKKWGGQPEDYLKIHEFLDSSKMTLGDIRHRSLYHHTLGVWLCQQIFGVTVVISRTPTNGLERTVRVPVREVAERHIIEDLGFLPTPADYLKNTPIEPWMSGSRRTEVPLSHILNALGAEATTEDTATTEGDTSE